MKNFEIVDWKQSLKNMIERFTIEDKDGFAD